MSGSAHSTPVSDARRLASSAPTVSSVSPAAGSTAGGASVTVLGTGFTGATAVRFGATLAPSFAVLSDTRIGATSPPGTGTVQVTVTTPSGTSNEFVTFSYGLGPAPSLTSITPNSGPATGGTTVVLTGSGLSAASAVRFGGVAAASFTVVSDTQISAVSPAGSGSVPVTVTTPAGTTGGVPFTYVAVSVPWLTSISPNSGPATGGTTVVLTGAGLSAASAVRFGGVAAASYTVVSDSRITAVAPPGTGTVQVTVTTAGGSSNGLAYTYSGAPALSGVSPDQGPTAGGNTVTLTGTGLTSATAVTFGSTPATSFTVVSPTTITAVVPPGAAGAVPVTVTTPGGTSTLPSSYFYVNAPVLAALAPVSGPLSGGNTVTLTGTHLVEATAVRFANTAATSFTVVSDTRITAVAPAGPAGPVDVTVSTAGGTSNAVSYAYVPAPALTALSPGQGPASGGNSVTLTGTGLGPTTRVLFGTTPATFTVVSDTHVVAEAPPGAVGPVDVTVVTPGGTSAPAGYTRVGPPAV
ncbi:IPT/TIG domain-containing protein [Streptomyces lydicus]|uniref:IPT/TIG domain-containing protein n=1 Tax=Streptomyces lydicus TaxID=47763 RepID=UPI003790CD73